MVGPTDEGTRIEEGRYAGVAQVLLNGGPVIDELTGRRIFHAGMGIVLGSRRVLTCAHVINTALRRPEEASEKPCESVLVSFPFARDCEPIQAEVTDWFPVANGAPRDVALITLKKDAPTKVGTATFQHVSRALDGDNLSIFGVAAGIETGHHVAARLIGRISDEEVQIDGVSQVGLFVEGGYSGAGIWDANCHTLVGMISARRTNPANRIAYMIPVAQLELAVPGLREPPQLAGLSLVFAQYAQHKRAGFVGRSYVFREIHKFLSEYECGYLTVLGEPGMGKSAILSELARRMDCAAQFFFIRAEGIVSGDTFHAHLAEQLSTRFGVAPSGASDVPRSVALRELLTKASSISGDAPLIAVVDALDECAEVDYNKRVGNLLHLPRELPKNTYFVLSRRHLHQDMRHFLLETDATVGNEMLDLHRYSAENRSDVEIYIRSFFLERPSHPWLSAQSLTLETAVNYLADRSESNFVYLHYMLPDLERRPHELTPTSLPQGLAEYYLGHWNRMISGDTADPETARTLALIYVITRAKAWVTYERMTELFSGCTLGQAQRFVAQWREFLEIRPGNEPAYRIYHDSFADFLARQDAVIYGGQQMRSANARLRDWGRRFLRGGKKR